VTTWADLTVYLKSLDVPGLFGLSSFSRNVSMKLIQYSTWMYIHLLARWHFIEKINYFKTQGDPIKSKKKNKLVMKKVILCAVSSDIELIYFLCDDYLYYCLAFNRNKMGATYHSS
jgi:hypothetical protein